jgi:WD40 repeat protein/DNA-binding SARP family transcriptional activator
VNDGQPADLRIKLFQSFEVTLDGQQLAKFEADTARALLAYLAVQPGKVIKREALATLLWDAQDTATALTNLRAALRRMRLALGSTDGNEAGPQETPHLADVIIAERTTLAFNPARAWVDVLAFEQMLAEARRHPHTAVEECPTCIDRLTEAVSLYRGPFLADLTLDIQAFEEWRRSERERLQRLAVAALYTLGEHAFRTGAFAEANAIAHRQISIEPWNEEAHRQLMRILFASGQRTAALAQYEICRRTLAEELGVDPDEETQTLYLRLLAGESPTPREVGDSPYRGLSSFSRDDADVFFGRSSVTQRLHAAVTGPGRAVIVGASGSGKSSVIHAGLIPVLVGQHGAAYTAPSAAATAGAVAHVVVMRPGQDPVAALNEALAGQVDNGAQPLAHTLLIVDQFEEVFTACTDEKLRIAFFDRLLAPPVPQDAPAPGLLLAMRADFMGEALRYATLADLLQNHTILLGPLSRSELRQVIEEPARLRGVAFEPGLVDRLLVDIGDGPGQLPLLQFALTQLWDHQSDGWVTHEAFDAIGGVRGALAGYAEKVFAALSPGEQAQAPHIFLTLVRPSPDAQDVRRMATRSEIGEERWPLVQRLADARLLVTNHNPRTGETAELVHEALIREWRRLQAWLNLDREFQTWRQRTRTALTLWQENPNDETNLLQGARLLEAERWMAERADEITVQHRDFIAASVAARERRTLAEEVARQRELESAQALAKIEHARAEDEARGRRRLTWLTFVLVVVAVIAALTAVLAFRAQQSADAERANAEETARIALARQLSAQAINAQETQIDLALLLNHESLRLSPGPRDSAELLLKTDLDPRLRRIMYGVNGAIYGVHLQADEASVLAHNEFGSVLLWDENGRQNTLLAATVEEQQGVVFSPRGSRVATWRGGGPITVRDGETTAPLFEIASPDGGLYNIAFSQDDSRLVVFWENERFQIWETESGALVEEFTVGEYATNLVKQSMPAVVTPDGHVIVLADEKDNIPLIVLWDIAADEAVATLPQNHTDEVHQVSVSPDGNLLATASYDGSVRLWDTTTGAQHGEALLGHTARALSVAFSPDGSTLVSGGADDQAILWDVATGQQKGAPLRGHSNAVRAGAFSTDGAMLVTGDSDGRALVWDVGMIQELRGHSDRVRAMLLSPDERTLVTAGFDKEIIVRDAATLRIERQIATDHQNAILNAAYSPDGATFATVDAGGLLVLWDTATWTPRHVLRSEVQNQLLGLAFSPDSQRVATGAFNGIVAVHDVITGAPVVAPFQAHENGWAMSLVYSPDGQRLYSGSSGQTIRMWDANTFAQIGEPLEGHTNWVTDLIISPDGTELVSASSDETIRVWDAQTGEPLGEPLVGHGRPVWSINFRTVNGDLALASIGADGKVIWWDWATRTPLGPPLQTGKETEWMRLSADGERLLVSFMNSVVSVIDADLTPWPERACAIANRNMTEAEWANYLPTLPYQASCPETAD